MENFQGVGTFSQSSQCFVGFSPIQDGLKVFWSHFDDPRRLTRMVMENLLDDGLVNGESGFRDALPENPGWELWVEPLALRRGRPTIGRSSKLEIYFRLRWMFQGTACFGLYAAESAMRPDQIISADLRNQLRKPKEQRDRAEIARQEERLERLEDQGLFGTLTIPDDWPDLKAAGKDPLGEWVPMAMYIAARSLAPPKDDAEARRRHAAAWGDAESVAEWERFVLGASGRASNDETIRAAHELYVAYLIDVRRSIRFHGVNPEYFREFFRARLLKTMRRFREIDSQPSPPSYSEPAPATLSEAARRMGRKESTVISRYVRRYAFKASNHRPPARPLTLSAEALDWIKREDEDIRQWQMIHKELIVAGSNKESAKRAISRQKNEHGRSPIEAALYLARKNRKGGQGEKYIDPTDVYHAHDEDAEDLEIGLAMVGGREVATEVGMRVINRQFQ